MKNRDLRILLLAVFLVLIIVLFVSLKNSEEADDYEDDGIVLMQHETEGFFRCFGCNEGSLGNPALCVDPASVMKPVLETQERYCGPDFEVIEDGKVVKN